MNPVRIDRPLAAGGVRAIRALADHLGIVPEDDPHVTLAYSKAPVDWDHPAFAPRDAALHVDPEQTFLERFGDRIVQVIRAPELEARHAEMRAAGASWDFPVYNAHVTIGADPDGRVTDLSGITPVTGPLSFGPERRFAIDIDPEPAP